MTELHAYLQQHQMNKVKFAFADLDGVLRGKFISLQKLEDTLTHGCGFCDVVFGWDSSDRLYENADTVTGWHTGFPDQICHIDLQTFRPIPWQQGIPFLLADFSQSPAGEAACPRSLLKRIIAKATGLGYTPRFAQEFEWFNFNETPASLQEKNFTDLQPLTPGMFGYSILRTSQQFDFVQTLFDELTDFNIPIEGLHTETGPGVYEAAIAHDTTLVAADKAVMFKTAVKELASRFGITASFMAKWNLQLPGCSGHVHQSFWDEKQTVNLFADASQPHGMSQLMQHYIAGQLYCLPHIMPMYAPTINSYKRLVTGAWAPTTVSWGFENRTTAIRVINPYAKATRVEMRVPGADSNPYLAIAASLASGLYGIQNKLALELPATVGNAYAQSDLQQLPYTLEMAAVAMQQSELAKEILGEKFVQHFTQTRLHECRQQDESDANWELKRYFEII
ncbi:MAG TPA: glutamine synthetase family protein [Phnomibacter sp.]|nr:glutamine synthetase family protein [Phnomibacter sp.]